MLLFTGVGELWYNLSEIEPKAKIEIRFTHTGSLNEAERSEG